MLQNLMIDGQPAEQADNYHFFTGDIDDFQSEFAAPKQDMGIEQAPEDLDEETLTPPKTTEEKRQAADGARKTAQFITSVGDTMLASSLAWLDHSGDPEPHKRMNDPLMADLENAIAYYCERVGGEIPPSIMIIICVMMLYGVQVPQALHDRKEWERLHAAPAAPRPHTHHDTPAPTEKPQHDKDEHEDNNGTE